VPLAQPLQEVSVNRILEGSIAAMYAVLKRHRITPDITMTDRTWAFIARALVVHPEIIFADEPTGNLDSHTTMDVLKLMQRIVREQNQTLVMVTHDNHLAAYADRIFHIIDGKIVKIEENRQMGKEDGKIEEI